MIRTTLDDRSLAALAALSAAQALGIRRRADPAEHLAWVESGEPLAAAGLAGLFDGIEDRPAGLLDGSQARKLIALASQAADRPELLGELYVRARPRSERLRHGEFYTPAWVVRRVLDSAGLAPAGDQRLLDPMCGAGAFLIEAVRRLALARPGLSAAGIADRIQGMEVSPLPVLLARAGWLLALAAARGRRFEPPPAVPVRRCDALRGRAEDEAHGRRFDIVAGNPPWVCWESLPAAWRAATKGLWLEHGLFEAGGRQEGRMSLLLGGGKKDLAMLATYAAADGWLAPDGVLCFVLPRSALKSAGSGCGFRRFVLRDGTPLKAERAEELAGPVFAGVGARPVILTLRRGESTRYPVPYTLRLGERGPEVRLAAEPVDRRDSRSPWLTAPREEMAGLRRLLGPSAYTARAGAYTGGANGVYWVRTTGSAPARSLAAIENLPEEGKRDVERVASLAEQDLLFPLLRARGVGRLRARPADWILLPQDPDRRRGIDGATMERLYPHALAYLRRMAEALAARRDRGTRALIASGAPFYTLFSVSRETLSPWKVVWPRIASRVQAAPVGPRRGRPVVPQETCSFVACPGGRTEASYLAGMLCSTRFHQAAAAFSAPGSKSFGAPHLLRHIAVPRWDRSDPRHAEVARRVMESGDGLRQAALDEAVSLVWDRARP